MVEQGIQASNVQESQRVYGLNPSTALGRAVECADVAVASWAENDILALWGVTRKSLLSETRIVWLITSDAVKKYRLLFLKECKRILNILENEYPLLENYVDTGNSQIINWLTWLGFNFDKEIVRTYHGHNIVRFWR